MLSILYKQIFGVSPDGMSPLTPAGSNRQYFRLTGPETVVGVIGTSVAENNAFIYLSRHFISKNLPVPDILAVSDDRLCYLQSDLGDTSLFEVRENLPLLKKTIATLPDFQYKGAEELDFSNCYSVESFDSQAVLWDLNYFKYCFLNTTGVSYSEPALESEFKRMAERLGHSEASTFMYRDFQSRNVLIKDGSPFFIDFQGGRRGPAEYDLVSFISQARAGFSDEVKETLIDTYIESASRYIDIDRPDFRDRLSEYEFLRNLQVLGAYGFRGKFERKPHFLKSIPLALKNLEKVLNRQTSRYPYLTTVLSEMLAAENTAPSIVSGQKSSLTVHVYSFSYKKGIPADNSGNGGGFVFDCRGMENPGRYPEYKDVTGLEKPVIDFLEAKGEIQPFMDHCYGLVDPSVECYDCRGFTSLTICFGCTGGQHRSVYGAQHMAEHIKAKYPHIAVHLIHREQNIDCLL